MSQICNSLLGRRILPYGPATKVTTAFIALDIEAVFGPPAQNVEDRFCLKRGEPPAVLTVHGGDLELDL